MSEKILQRVMKLHKHAESALASGNVAEADAFMGKVHTLLADHALTLESALSLDAESCEIKLQGVVDLGKEGTRVARWEMVLAEIVARHHGCVPLYNMELSTIALVGRHEDAQVAAYMIQRLHRFASETANRMMPDMGGSYGAWIQVSFGQHAAISYLEGFAEGLAARYEALSAKHAGGAALVRLAGQAEKVAQERSRPIQDEEVPQPEGGDFFSRMKGFQAAHAVSLTPDGITEADASNQLKGT